MTHIFLEALVMANLAIIIVTFGRFDLTKQTLESLFACGIETGDQVIVVDNGSQPEVVQMLMGFRDKIDHLVFLKGNYGKSYGLNVGIQLANEICIVEQKQIPDHFLFCDNDLEFLPNWKSRLIETYEDHKTLPLCCLSAHRWSSHPLDIIKGKTTEINRIRFCAGCCILISKQALAANGIWDTRRKIGAIDTTYMRNAINRGYVNAAVHPETLIRHTGISQRSWNLANWQPKLLP